MNSPNRLPLLLLGARQVGKTWLLREFGKQSFADVAYFSLDQDPDLKDFFEKSKDPKRIVDLIGLLRGRPLVPGKTLLILDEIQESNSALNALKYFAENMPELHVAASGSYLGVALSKPAAFPVGKVNFMRLHPMSFEEFLLANDCEALLSFCDQASLGEPLPELVLHKLQEHLQQYWLIGGMPAVVKTWVEQKNLEQIEQRQAELLLSYERDFTKHADKRMVPKIWQIWDSIPAQLAKENKKFQYAKIKSGARSKDYEDAMTWLVNTGLVHRVTKVTKPGIPLSAYEEADSFKLYMLDVGLLRAKAGLHAKPLLQGNAFFTEFKGSLVENFFLQEFLAHSMQTKVHYWTSDANAEVDFILPITQPPLPVEVKSGNAVHAKSLRLFMEKYNIPIGCRMSPLNLRLDGGILNIPLSMMHQMQKLVEQT